MKRVYLTKPHLRDALEQRADTVVGDITTFIQIIDYYTQPRRGFALVEPQEPEGCGLSAYAEWLGSTDK
jgi:hypothetical protein